MKDSPRYLTINIAEDGTIHSVKTPDGVSIPISDESLIEAPLNLGNMRLGEFKTITLVKMIATDDSYTWLVKPSGNSDFCRLCRRFVAPFEFWIKTCKEN